MAKTLTISIMEPPYESATSTTSMRIIDAALRKGMNVNVFAYEGAVSLTIKDQKPHPNPVHGTSVDEWFRIGVGILPPFQLLALR